MIVTCDIGGSKGDWGFIGHDREIITVETPGFNPFIHDSSLFQEQLKSSFQNIDLSKVNTVYYYGTGCREESSKIKVRNLLHSIFLHAELEVDIDLLASARATCGHQKGIACILGTGANSGLYDGKYIVDNLSLIHIYTGTHGYTKILTCI